MNELNQLMNEINRKYVEQRRRYEEKLHEMVSDLAKKDEKIKRLTEENDKFRRIFKSQEANMKTECCSTTPSIDLIKVDAETNTNLWDDLLEGELKERLEAFVELYRTTPIERLSIGADRQPNQQEIFSNSMKTSLQPIHRRRSNDKSAEYCSFNEPPTSFIDKSPNRQIDRLERNLNKFYDELTIDASNLLKKKDDKHLFSN